MDLSSLKPACGSTHHEKRIGRGQGSGKGGTSTRGHKEATPQILGMVAKISHLVRVEEVK